MSAAPQIPAWVVELYTLVDAGELDRYLAEFYADDARLRFASGPQVQGKPAIREALGHGHAVHDMDHTIRRLWQDDDTTIIEFDVRYTFRDGSALDTQSLAVLERGDDGLIRDMRVYVDHGPVQAMADAAADAQNAG
jgi:ketosteroid isomerase-like protein